MPYILDEYGNEHYTDSKYAKEELPTWNEIWNWYRNDNKNYTLNQDPVEQKVDTYWNLPKKKVDICFICNHLNKLLYEDGGLEKVHEKFEEYRQLKLYFGITLQRGDSKFEMISISGVLGTEMWETTNRLEGGLPVLYTLNIPRTDARSLFSSDAVHNYITDIPMHPGDSIYLSLYDAETMTMLRGDIEHNVLKFVLEDLIEYFTGTHVGWKTDPDTNDESSNLTILQNTPDPKYHHMFPDKNGETEKSSGPITKDDVYKLHDITGRGLMECKKALAESDGNQEKAITILRNTGMNGLLGHKATI